MINFEELTLDEIEEIETLVGRPIDEAFADGKPKGRALKVLYFIIMRKQDPKYKFEDAGKVSQAEVLKLLQKDNDPKAQ